MTNHVLKESNNIINSSHFVASCLYDKNHAQGCYQRLDACVVIYQSKKEKQLDECMYTPSC